jgi:hypothetical protein
MLNLDRSFAVFSERMENAHIRLQGVEVKIDQMKDISWRVKRMEERMDRNHP